MINLFHADFVARHLELLASTEAWIGRGQAAETAYPIRKVNEGDRISLGDVTLQIVEPLATRSRRSRRR
ncbi:hypothetical protein [Amycolatopsis pretoriensis]|uniref:hypothetical protein n=1 Tax=Amycolatopsis pretoriensis TaxID=218821 RepID=UPI000A3853F9|nr:hypothetical protein [Amycolatopsis pretoriensis]